MTRKTKVARKCKEAGKASWKAKQSRTMTSESESDNLTADARPTECLPDATPQPSTSSLVPTASPVSSAKKRRRLFFSSPKKTSKTGKVQVEKDKNMVFLSAGDVKKLSESVVCRDCFASPVCHIKDVGLDSAVSVICSECDKEILCSNPELTQFRCGKNKFYSNTMRLVYSCMLDGMSYMSVKTSCALLRLPVVNKRQFLKYKDKIRNVAIELAQRNLDECVAQVFSYYANELNRHPDEDGILDIDVTYDGK